MGTGHSQLPQTANTPRLSCFDSFSYKSNSVIKDAIQLSDGRLVFGFKYSEISIRDVARKKWVAHSKARVSINHLLQFNDSKFLSNSGFYTSYVECWDIHTLKSKKMKQPPFNDETQIYSLIQLKSNAIAIGLRSSQIEICRLEPYELLDILSGHQKAVFLLIQLSNGLLVSSSLDKTIRLWAKDTFASEGAMTDKSIASCIIELKPNRIASCSEDKTVKIWCLHSKQCTTIISLGNHSVLQIIQLDDYRLIAGVFDHLAIINPLTLKCEKIIKAHEDQIIHFLLLRQNQLLSCDKLSFKIWSVEE